MTALVLKKDEQLNKVLTTMWELNNLIATKVPLSTNQIEFYNTHIEVIKHYYVRNANYWSMQKHQTLPD